jgi:hypothetical protein
MQCRVMSYVGTCICIDTFFLLDMFRSLYTLYKEFIVSKWSNITQGPIERCTKRATDVNLILFIMYLICSYIVAFL